MRRLIWPFLQRAKRWVLFVLNLLLYPLSGLWRRADDRWAFGHTRDVFAGNPKYLFLWMALHRPDLHLTWISASARTRRLLRANGYRARARWSPRGMLAALRAGTFVFAHGTDNVNAQLSRGAFLLNLWHGVGLKAVHVGHEAGMTADAYRQAMGAVARLFVLHHIIPYDAVVSTSDLMQAHFAAQFRLPPDRCPQLGYPRLDCVADPALARLAEELDHSVGFEMNPDGFREVYIYLPTFRDTGRPFFERALPDLDRLSGILKARDALLYLKPHIRTLEHFSANYPNIRIWPDAIDFHTYLGRFTGLITDYSSVLYDYLFLKQTGAILYTFDFEEYVTRDRALIYPYEDNVAGLRIATFDALCDVLRDGAALDPAGAPNATAIRARFWGGSCAPASPAIVDYVERQLGRRRGNG